MKIFKHLYKRHSSLAKTAQSIGRQNRKNKPHRRIDEVIAEKLKRDFAIDADEWEKQTTVCSNHEILEPSQITMPAKQDARLSKSLNKQNKGKLCADEQNEMRQLMETSRLATLKKAYALREIS